MTHFSEQCLQRCEGERVRGVVGASSGRPRDLHRLLVEGDGGEALGFLQDDGGGGAQAALTCVRARRRSDTFADSHLFSFYISHSRGSASFRSSLFSLLMEDEDDILWTCVCRFCSSTTERTRS